MKDIVPFEAYSEGLAAIPTRRLAIISGALFGLLLACSLAALTALMGTLRLLLGG